MSDIRQLAPADQIAICINHLQKHGFTVKVMCPIWSQMLF